MTKKKESKTIYQEVLEKFKQSSSDKFAAIATEQFNTFLKEIKNYFSGQMCPDQHVCKIENIQNDYFDLEKRKNIFTDGTSTVIENNIPDAENIFLLILESPHRDEFYAKDVKDKNGTIIHHKGEPIGPANGPTGTNIREHIAEIFPDFSNYHLVLMNAIPFQCSLGVIPEHFRDDVFNVAWNDENIGARFFEKRLKNLLDKLEKKNVVIVNACTKDNKDNSKKKNGRKNNVTEIIKNLIESKTVVKKVVKEVWETPHPSSPSWCSHKGCKRRFPLEN